MFNWLKKSLSTRAAGTRSTPDNGDSRPLLEGDVDEGSADPDAIKALADRLFDRGDLAGAREQYRRALALRPDMAPAWNNLGLVLLQAGEAAHARAALEEATRAGPHLDAVWVNLANAQEATGDIDGAAASLARAVEANPASRDARANAGANALARGRPSEAMAHLEAGLRTWPDDPGLILNATIALRAQARIDQAIAFARAALDRGIVTSDLVDASLLTLNYSDRLEPEAIHATHVALAAALSHAGAAPGEQVHRASRATGRRLRVGLVSADLGYHVVSFFLEPVLRAIDPSSVELFAYFTGEGEDDRVRQFRGLTEHWRSVAALPTDECVRAMRADDLDVAIDLSGHTAGNRLDVFASRVAPVQATWLGYPNTTGLREMDFRITDAIADPPGATDGWHSEVLWRLPRGFLVYQPRPEAPDVAPAPCARGAGVTFGCFNNLAKVSDTALRLWARILSEMPDACLLLKAKGLGEAATADEQRRRFGQAGGDVSRLRLEGEVPRYADHLGAYGRVDVALDSTPYCGTTTTCEALWMGVPVVTLAGRAHVARVGASLLSQAGHPEWIAQSDREYVDIAMGLARDPAALARIRSGLRDEMRASPLTDGPAFAGELTAALRAMCEAARRHDKAMGKTCSSG